MMKNTIVLLIICFSLTSVAQKSTEVGLWGGVSYYVGELNPRGHFNTSFLHPSVGFMLRRNLNTRYALKTNIIFGKVSGDDALSHVLQYQERNLAFSSTIIELSAQIEFNFLKYNILDLNNQLAASPYVFIGLGAFYFNPETNLGGKNYESNYSLFQPCMPFGLGLKMKFSHRFTTSIDWGLRRTFTDYIDDVSTVYLDSDNAGMQRGNSKTKDWYSFAGILFTIRLGEKPNDCEYQ